MKTIRISMPDDVFARLSKRARKEKRSGIASLLLDGVGEHNEESETISVVNQALKAGERQEVGQKFRMKDLFPAKWELLDKGVRIRAGRQFFAKVSSDNDLKIKDLKKMASGHQFYVRIKD